MIIFQLQELNPRLFQAEFDRVNLHHPTMVVGEAGGMRVTAAACAAALVLAASGV